MLHQRVTRCILIWLVGIMKLHSVGLRGPGGLSGEHPESPQPAGLNFIDPIFAVRHAWAKVKAGRAGLLAALTPCGEITEWLGGSHP
jgi:hypothetical protein